MNLSTRIRAFIELSKYTGRNVTSDFIRNTSIHFPQAQIPRIHNLVEGIYKPAGDSYAFCIWSRSAAGMDTEVYSDRLNIETDGSWSIHYAAKIGSLDSAVNKSLFLCLQKKVPILVIVTFRPSTSSQRALYRIMGPALIEAFDPSSRLFTLRGCSQHVCEQFEKSSNQVDAFKLYMRNQLIIPFQLKESRSLYIASREIRDKAFRTIILEEYRDQCSVCQSKFLLMQRGKDPLIEAEAAHIIPVKLRGPDDPRNGISFCKRHHWAFDEGLFTVTDGGRIQVSPAVRKAVKERFDLEEYDGETIIPPASEACRPTEEALHWHQKQIFRRV